MQGAAHVLIIEPDADTRDALRDLLQRCGAPLSFASSVDEASRWLHGGGRPCIVIVDPAPSQRAAVAAFVGLLRMSQQTVDVPVIALTGFDLKPFDDRTTILPKPFPADSLLALVSASVARCA